MTPPFVNYITFNRLGLTAKSLKSILDTPEDFEMHIIDSNSGDDTWEYLQTVKDPRIKSMLRLPVNTGPIPALNLNLTRRKPDQYFFNIDSDVVVKTKDWVTRFMKVFQAFPEVGLLGVQRVAPYIPIYPEVIPKVKGDACYLELKNGFVDVILDFVHGCFMCMRPELIKEIGYWSEETCWGDAELTPRVIHYTKFKTGYMSDPNKTPLIDIAMDQQIGCHECLAKGVCKFNKTTDTCFTIRARRYQNESFVSKFKWKYLEFFKELAEGKRTAYCASMYDPASMANHVYNREWALENMNFYIQNSN